MATGENVEELQKENVADPTDTTQDNIKKNEAETKDIAVEDKGNEADQAEKKKDEVQNADASKADEKSSSKTTEEKPEDVKKDKDSDEEVVKEVEKKNEAEPVVPNKEKEADQTEEKKKEEVEKADDASKSTKVDEKSSSMETNEKTEGTNKDKGLVEAVVKEEKKIEEPSKGKEADQGEKKKDEVENVNASKAEKSSSMAKEEKSEDVNKDKGLVRKVVKEEEKKEIEAEPKDTVAKVQNQEKEANQTEKQKEEVVEKAADASKETKVEKKSSEEVVKEEKKKIEAEPREVAVENKGKEVDQTEMKKKDEVEKADDASKVEKSSSITTKEKLEDAEKDKESAVKEEMKKDEAKKVDVYTVETEETLEEVDLDNSVVEEVVKEENKKEETAADDSSKAESGGVEKSSSLREQRNSMSDLKENEKKALSGLRSIIENGIHGNKLFKENKDEVEEEENEKEKDVEETEVNDDKETPKVEEVEETADSNKQKDEEKEKKDEQETKNKDVPKVINKDIAIWGVPLLPSKEDRAIDVILLKFLRAKEFDVDEAFEMLRDTLQWRKDNNIDSILDKNFHDDFGSMSSQNGFGREGHPVCYNIFKPLGNEDFYKKVLGTEEMRNMFVMSKVQLLERAIQKLNFKKPGGVCSIFIVNDLKDIPGPSKKEFRSAIKQVLTILQDHYPEFVARNIFINVPFWYYAFSASSLLSPFLTPKTNTNVFARPSKVNDVLLKYIALEELTTQYGGLRKENDSDFSSEDVASEIFVNRSSKESIQIPASEGGMTLIWEVLAIGGEVNYKEEFIPTDENSSGVVFQNKKIGAQEGSIRNSYTNEEPGNVVLTIENGALIKKKRICYRYKYHSSS